MESVKVIAKRVFQEDKMEEALQLYQQLKVETIKETGCIGYELFQDTKNPTTMVMIEEWANDIAFKSHVNSAHIKEIGPKLAALGIQPMELTILKKVL
jgi:quinol monooxygenase YgiN